MMKVIFYSQTPKGPEEIGSIKLENGQLVADPPDSTALLNVLDEQIQYLSPSGITLLDSRITPELFMKELPNMYHGTYFWAKMTET